MNLDSCIYIADYLYLHQTTFCFNSHFFLNSCDKTIDRYNHQSSNQNNRAHICIVFAFFSLCMYMWTKNKMYFYCLLQRLYITICYNVIAYTIQFGLHRLSLISTFDFVLFVSFLVAQ